MTKAQKEAEKIVRAMAKGRCEKGPIYGVICKKVDFKQAVHLHVPIEYCLVCRSKRWVKEQGAK